MSRQDFDSMIGRLDRLLSEMMIESMRIDLDAMDKQTLKHHAEDMIGAGQSVLKKLGSQSSAAMERARKAGCDQWGLDDLLKLVNSSVRL